MSFQRLILSPLFAAIYTSSQWGIASNRPKTKIHTGNVWRVNVTCGPMTWKVSSACTQVISRGSVPDTWPSSRHVWGHRRKTMIDWRCFWGLKGILQCMQLWMLKVTVYIVPAYQFSSNWQKHNHRWSYDLTYSGRSYIYILEVYTITLGTHVGPAGR